MTIGSPLPARVRKEFRGLSPAWIACLASVAVAALLGDRVRAVGLVGYFLATVALGALSMGQEYNGRTLTLFLSQPARRERLLLEKLAVLAATLLVSGMAASLGLFAAVPWGRSVAWENWSILAVALPLLCGFFLAPWLTMACRNALAGMVFALAIPGIVWIASDLTSALIFGDELSGIAAASDFTFDLFWRGMLVVCVLAAASGWWLFMRLEAIESRGMEVHLPTWLRRPARPLAATPVIARRHATWLLVKKELRLQQLTFAVSALYVVCCVGLWLFRHSFPQQQIILIPAMTALHAWAIALLAGSLPSAEERQLGTLEWQVLLPMSAWKQWTVKAGVAVSVAMLLALALPAVVSGIASTPEIRNELRHFYTSPIIALALLAATVCSVYVSTLCANGLRALLVSLPVVTVVMGAATRSVVSPIYGRFGMDLVFSPGRYQGLFGARETILWTLLTIVAVAIGSGTAALLLRFAMTNHRSAERGTTRVWTQLSWMAGFLMVGSLVWYGVFTFFVDGVNQRSQAARRQMMAQFATATFVIENGGNAGSQDSVVIVFPDVRTEGRAPGAPRPYYVIHADRAGRFSNEFVRPGILYAVAAVAKPGGSVRALEVDLQTDRGLRERLEKSATSITLRQGEAATIPLTPTHVP